MTLHDDPAPLALGDAPDADLVLRTRAGDTAAFGELWRRHYRSGLHIARSVTSTLDPDDLVQESYARIYQTILKGGGPTGSFRAYLFTSIRNTAAGWGRARRETAIPELDAFEDPATTDRAAMHALDSGLAHTAFNSLPTRWQEVLWYTEIEQLKPADIAPLLGMKPTAVAQLTFRAREGLREAWVQAHLRPVDDGSACQWTVERLGAYALRRLGRRDHAKVEAHLVECARCTLVASEARDASRRLALILVPLTVYAAATGAHLASLSSGAAPVVALAAMPSSVLKGAVEGAVEGSVTAASAGSTGGALSSIGAIAGLVAAGVVIVGGVAAGVSLLSLPGESSPPPAAGSAVVDPRPRPSSPPQPSLLPRPETSASTTPELPVLPDPPVLPADPPETPETAETPVEVEAAGGASGTTASAEPEAPPEPVRPVLPPGTPSIALLATTVSDPIPPATGSSSVAVALQLTGAPATSVEVSLGGAAIATVTLDGFGAGTIVLPATIAAIRSNPLVEVRYVAGELRGPSVPVGLRDLTGPVLPAGSPAITAATSAVVSADFDFDVTLTLQGEPGATVEVAFAGAAQTLVLDEAGFGTILRRTTVPEVLSDPAVRVRYLDGALAGQVASGSLLALLGYAVDETPQP